MYLFISILVPLQGQSFNSISDNTWCKLFFSSAPWLLRTRPTSWMNSSVEQEPLWKLFRSFIVNWLLWLRSIRRTIAGTLLVPWKQRSYCKIIHIYLPFSPPLRVWRVAGPAGPGRGWLLHVSLFRRQLPLPGRRCRPLSQPDLLHLPGLMMLSF